MSLAHDRAQSRAYSTQHLQHDRHRAEQSHDAACDWLDAHPFPCGGSLDDHLMRCRDAVSQRLGFFDPGSLMLIWSVLSALWSFYQWLADDENTPRP